MIDEELVPHLPKSLKFIAHNGRGTGFIYFWRE
jgi:hypothetical protein